MPSDDIFEVSGPAQVGELWRHVRGTATEVVLAGLLVRYGDRSLGVQNLVLRRRDVRGVAADAELERMDGFTELSVTREAAVIHLAFCSFRVEPSLGLELHRWDVEIEPSGPLEVTVRCIGRVLGGTPTSN
jgi:hypothetical protein